MTCPHCKDLIDIDPNQCSSEFYETFRLHKESCNEIKTKAISIGKVEGFDWKEGVVRGDDDSLAKFMLEKTTLYNCNECGKIYYGGLFDDAGRARENKNRQNFLCKTCAEDYLGYGKEICEIHGNEFVDWKCKNCCSIALFVCDNGTDFTC